MVAIGNEAEIHRMIREEGRDARWFAFGIGSSVNRLLIDGIAENGRGESIVVLPREQKSAEKAARKFFDFIDSPVLNDVSLEWGSLPVADVYPSQPRDLFRARPLIVVGRFTGAAEGTVTLRGRVGSSTREFALPVSLPEVQPPAQLSRPNLGAAAYCGTHEPARRAKRPGHRRDDQEPRARVPPGQRLHIVRRGR